MNRTALFGLRVCMALTMVGLAQAELVSVEYTFDRPEISQVTLGGQQFDRVSMPGCSNGGNAGEPALPATGAQILIPYGCEVASIEVLSNEKVLLGNGYMIEPVSQPVKLSEMSPVPVAPTPDPAIYGSDQVFPGDRFVNVGTHGFRGYQILTLRLQPVQYVPSTGALFYHPRFTVVVNTTETGQQSPLLRGMPSDEQQVMAKVDNPQTARTYAGAGTGVSRAYDLLILTTPTLESSFVPLKNYHDAHGIATEIHTTSDVGSTDPDDVRDYISDRYSTDGIEYVLIGGDDDVIPAQNLYVLAYAGGDLETAMPGDVFFGCLDGTWNYDGDSYHGETTDGPGGGDVDLVAEVYIGRASVGNTTEAARFVTKTLWYLNGGHAYPEKVLLVGEYLGFGGVSDYAANTLEELIDGSSANGYTTVGIPSSDYTFDELFERDMSWSQATLVSRINSSVHILNHLGHGSETYAMKLYNSDVTSDLTNTDLCFVYSQTCLAGHFDGTDCWAETMNIKTDYGGFAVVMNARYGWGEYNSTDGPSQRFNREFWDAVFDEGMPELARANHDSKEDNLYRVNQDCMRWCYYEINLFGDPTVRVQGVERKLSIGLPSGVPSMLSPGVATDITVEIDPGDESYVGGSGTLYYRYDGGSYQTSALVHQSGYLYTATLPPANCDDTPEYYFSAQGTVNGVVYSPADAPTSVYTAEVGEWQVVFEDDFETDKGWTVSAGADTGNWERANPEEVDNSGTITQPEDDHTASGTLCFVTDATAGTSAGSYDLDGGPSVLTSPVLDLAGTTAYVSYWRWYHISTQWNDEMVVEVSNNNGADWVTVETITDRETWTYVQWNVADYVTPTSQVRVRFTVDDSPNDSLVEALIDDFVVEAVTCSQPYPLGDMNCDGIVNNFDIDPFVLAITGAPPYTEYYDLYPGCNHMLGDCNEDGTLNNFDIDPFVDLLT